MPTINDLDPGGAHPFPATQVGQVIGNALVEDSRTIIWARGRSVEQQNVAFWATAWQGAGGQAAGSYLALRYLLRQLEELAGNSDMQPVYIRWAATAQSGQYNVDTPHDGWYLISDLQPDYTTVVGGMVQVKMTAQHVAPASPSSLGLRWSGGALASTYTSVPVPLLAYPIGATQQPAIALSRTGGEGAIPLSVPASSAIQPAYFARPGTIAGLFTGGARAYDTVVAGGNAVPAAGAGFTNVNWVQVYGPAHGLVGDLVLTNGLLLLRFNQGGIGVPDMYLWNTQGTAGWVQVASLQYKDSPGINVGTIRGIDLTTVGYQAAAVSLVLTTSAGNNARFAVELAAGQYGFAVLPDFRTQANSVAYGLDLIYTTAVKVVANEGAAVDVGLNPSTNLAPSSGAGWGVGIGTTANQPLVGLGWQNPPNAGQPGAGSTTDIGFGETTGPPQNTPRRYFVWAAPFVTAQNLQAEAETGTLDAGWTSVTDGSVQAAKCASGTVAGRADLFGATWQPTPGVYDLWVQVRVASVTSGVNAWNAGLWDRTSAAFVGTPLAIAPSGLSTSYVWVRVATDVTPTAAHNMGYRIVTTATTATDLFVNQATLLPKRSATLGQGDMPADVWAQLMYQRETEFV